jgi:hypothetical protein
MIKIDGIFFHLLIVFSKEVIQFNIIICISIIKEMEINMNMLILDFKANITISLDFHWNSAAAAASSSSKPYLRIRTYGERCGARKFKGKNFLTKNLYNMPIIVLMSFSFFGIGISDYIGTGLG